MSIELRIPNVGESIQEVQIGRWLKQEGDPVETDEIVVELETDKASVELPAPDAGVIQKILKREGESVSIGEAIALLDKADGALSKEKLAEHQPPEEPAASKTSIPVTPSARRALLEHGLRAEDIAEPTGNRIRPEDVLRTVEERKQRAGDGKAKEAAPPEPAPQTKQKEPSIGVQTAAGNREEVVPMSLIRRRIAATLVEAQQTAALLTTFNEIDMSSVVALRKEYGEQFRKKYEVKLGFMSFFVKAVVEALQEFPPLNAEVRGTDIVYRNYFDIGIAIGSDRGLVVPVLRGAERLSFAQIEQAIGDFATRAQTNKLKPEELTGGTFTISNGGIYGSLLSTPIVNPPQSGVLGMHAIQDRPIARAGEVIICPMMYVALTYDHRIVDGREAVSFLQRVAEVVEEPARMLIEV